MGQLRPFLFIFVLFNHNFYRKNFSEIRTRIVGVEGKYYDHLTTTTAQFPVLYMAKYGAII